jgi:hypothetical protein
VYKLENKHCIIENGPPPSRICSEGGDGMVVVEGQRKVGICGIRLVEDGVGAGDVV